MKSIPRYVWEIGLALWLGLLLPAGACAQQRQVVLLRNGTTLQGHVVREGDYYYVAVVRGEIQLRAAQVERVCDSLEECFHYRLAHLLPGDVQGRLELAQWCVEHDLVRQAAVLVDQLQRTCPQHPRLALLRRKLDLSRRRKTGVPAGETEPPAGSASAAQVYRRQQQQAREDQALLEPLEPQAVRRFTISVHRILQNRCAAGGCHGPGAKNAFRMIRASQGRISPRVVRHNLVQVLRWIDRRQVDRSLLLRKALTPHGSQGLYQFQGLDKHSARVLRQWLNQLQQHPEQADRADSPARSSREPSATAKRHLPETVNRRLFQQQAQGSSTSRPEPSQPATAAVVRVSRSRAALPGTSPYDPAWFNRRYHGASSLPGAAAGRGPSTAAAGARDGDSSGSRAPRTTVSHSRSGPSVDKNKGIEVLHKSRASSETPQP